MTAPALLSVSWWVARSIVAAMSVFVSTTSASATHPVLPLGRTGRYTSCQSVPVASTARCAIRNVAGAPDGSGLEIATGFTVPSPAVSSCSWGPPGES